MARYRRLEGEPAEGVITVRLVRDGDEVKAFITGIQGTEDPAEEGVYPPEEMAPDEAFRIVENKREAIGDAEVTVMMEPGIDWNPAWGELG